MRYDQEEYTYLYIDAVERNANMSFMSFCLNKKIFCLSRKVFCLVCPFCQTTQLAENYLIICVFGKIDVILHPQIVVPCIDGARLRMFHI